MFEGMEPMEIEDEGTLLRGYVAVPERVQPAPAVLVMHSALGAAHGVNEPIARSLAQQGYVAIAARPDVDAQRIAAVGFCYGGMTVLELARSGADLKAAVSYHGTLNTHARAEPGVVRGHVVAYCGAEDPYAPLEDVDNLRTELQDAGVRYQITTFGGVAHGFTDPESAVLHLDGVEYDALANDLSWSGTLVLLQHVFGRGDA